MTIIDPRAEVGNSDAVLGENVVVLRAAASGTEAWRVVIYAMGNDEYVVHLQDFHRFGAWEVLWEDVLLGPDAAAEMAMDFAHSEALTRALQAIFAHMPITGADVASHKRSEAIMGFGADDTAGYAGDAPNDPMHHAPLADVLFS